MQAFSKVKDDSASRHQEQIFQRNDGILIMNKRKQNICSELHHFIDAQRSPRRSSAWLTSHLSNFRGTDSNRRQMDLLALLAIVYFAVDELARELEDKARVITLILHEQQFEKLTQRICLQSMPSARSRMQQLQRQPAIPPRFCRINA